MSDTIDTQEHYPGHERDGDWKHSLFLLLTGAALAWLVLWLISACPKTGEPKVTRWVVGFTTSHPGTGLKYNRVVCVVSGPMNEQAFQHLQQYELKTVNDALPCDDRSDHIIITFLHRLDP